MNANIALNASTSTPTSTAGNDLNEDITPIEAGLTWTVGKRRREACDFLGGDRIKQQMADGVAQRRVGFVIPSGAPARQGSAVSAYLACCRVGVARCVQRAPAARIRAMPACAFVDRRALPPTGHRLPGADARGQEGGGDHQRRFLALPQEEHRYGVSIVGATASA